MAKRKTAAIQGLQKCPTGIEGLDEITEGGLPRGRTTLVCGGAGSGKTLLAMEFIIRGITDFNEPGVFMSFEETAEELATNVASLGFDVEGLIRDKKMAIDFVRVERSEIEETGEYDLEGLFLRLNLMIDDVGAKRVVLDTLEALFAGLPNEAILRAELRRLFRWLKDKGVTAVITGEQGEQTLSRYGLEEYVSDCVIFLDHRVQNQIATRRLRIVKYRGSKHGTNEYPTLIDEHGLSVLPISSLGLTYPVTRERVSSGIARLDAMLGGKGYYRGSSIMVAGMAGTGKSSLAATFLNNLCRKGERCLYFSYEESPDQILRNMSSIGLDLKNCMNKGLLKFQSLRPSLYGLEMHLANVHKIVNDFKPSAVVMDPITNLISVGETSEVKAMLTRIIDFLKNEGITGLYTSLTGAGSPVEQTEMGVSSLMDTWVLLRTEETNGEHNRLLYVLKSRGMSHSNQVREFLMTDDGIKLHDAYIGPGMVLTGSARLVQEAKDKHASDNEREESARRRRQLRQKREELDAQIRALKERLEDAESDLKAVQESDRKRQEASGIELQALKAIRKAD